MRRVTIKRSADGGIIEVRAGDKVLGEVSGLASQSDTVMSASFAHRPSYADFAPRFQHLARALAAGNDQEAAGIRDSLEAEHVGVWHTSHEMRIDRPRSLVIAEGRASFAPNDAFLMMRTGGL